MSAQGAVVCPACEGLKNAGDWLCGACWGRLSPLEQREAAATGQGRVVAIRRARWLFQEASRVRKGVRR